MYANIWKLNMQIWSINLNFLFYRAEIPTDQHFSNIL